MIQLTDKQIEFVKMELNSVDTDTLYKDYLHEVYGEVEIAGHSYDVAHALEQVDPTAYRVGQADYEADLEERGYTEINGMYYDDTEVQDALDKMEDEDEE